MEHRDAYNYIQPKFGIGSKVVIDGKWISTVQGFKPPSTYVVLVSGRKQTRTVREKRLQPYYGDADVNWRFKLPRNYTGTAGLGQQQTGETEGAPTPDPLEGRDPEIVALLQRVMDAIQNCLEEYLKILEEIGLAFKKNENWEILYQDGKDIKTILLTKDNIRWLISPSVGGAAAGTPINVTPKMKVLKILIEYLNKVKAVSESFIMNYDVLGAELAILDECGTTTPLFKAAVVQIRFDMTIVVVQACMDNLSKLQAEIGVVKMSQEGIAKIQSAYSAFEKAKATRTMSDVQRALDVCRDVFAWLENTRGAITEDPEDKLLLDELPGLKEQFRVFLQKYMYLLEDPAELQRVAKNPDLVRRLLNEALALSTKVQGFTTPSQAKTIKTTHLPKLYSILKKVQANLYTRDQIAQREAQAAAAGRVIVEPRRRRRRWYEKIGNWLVLGFLLSLLAATGPALVRTTKDVGEIIFGGGR